MSPEEQARKLRQISELQTRDDLVGWARGVNVMGRGWFPGEYQALIARAKELRVEL